MTFETNARVTKIFLADDDSEDLLVSRSSDDRKHYRLEESSLLGELRYHDIIRAEPQTDGSLRFVRVEFPSELKSISWVLPEHAFELSTLAALLKAVTAGGGYWERTFGGMLTFHVPPAEEGPIREQFESLFSSWNNSITR